MQNFATDREESVVDGVCFAVPIFGESGDVGAAVSTSIPKVRVRGTAHEQAVIAALTAAATDIAANLFVR